MPTAFHNEMNHRLLHFYVCIYCGSPFRREEVEGRVHTTGLFCARNAGEKGR